MPADEIAGATRGVKKVVDHATPAQLSQFAAHVTDDALYQGALKNIDLFLDVDSVKAFGRFSDDLAPTIPPLPDVVNNMTDLAKATGNPNLHVDMIENMFQGTDLLRTPPPEKRLIKGLISLPDAEPLATGAKSLFSSLATTYTRGEPFEPMAIKYMIENSLFDLGSVSQAGKKYKPTATHTAAGVVLKQTEADLLVLNINATDFGGLFPPNSNIFLDVKLRKTNANWKAGQLDTLKEMIEETLENLRLGDDAVHGAVFPVGQTSTGQLGGFPNGVDDGNFLNKVDEMNDYFRDTHGLDYDVIQKADGGPVPKQANGTN